MKNIIADNKALIKENKDIADFARSCLNANTLLIKKNKLLISALRETMLDAERLARFIAKEKKYKFQQLRSIANGKAAIKFNNRIRPMKKLTLV
jgi:hypothetical protein